MLIKPIPKPKKKRNQTIGYWSRKADRKLQELAREMYNGCFIPGCKDPYSCVHHFVRKSQSTLLRYNWLNLIPICAKHHGSHHSYGDSTVHAEIQKEKGEAWIEEILSIKRKGIGMSAGYTYYREMYNKLNKCSN